MTLEIAVRKITVRVHTLDGKSVEAALFLHRIGTHDTHWQGLGELLNDASLSYLPCEVAGETELWNVESMVQVEMSEREAGGQEDAEITPGIEPFRRPAGLHLVTGDFLEGRLVYEAPEDNARITDFINDHTPRFVLLETDGRKVFVRAAAITRIRIGR